MQDPALYLTIALAGLAGLSIVTMATLRGWNGWLELKRAELGHRGEASAPRQLPRGSRSPTLRNASASWKRSRRVWICKVQKAGSPPGKSPYMGGHDRSKRPGRYLRRI